MYSLNRLDKIVAYSDAQKSEVLYLLITTGTNSDYSRLIKQYSVFTY